MNQKTERMMGEAFPVERERGVDKMESREVFLRECGCLWAFLKTCLFVERVCVRACVFMCEGAGVVTHRAISTGVGSFVHCGRCVTP